MEVSLKKQFIDDLALVEPEGVKRSIEINEAMAGALRPLGYRRDPVNQGIHRKGSVQVVVGFPDQEGTYSVSGVDSLPKELAHIFEPYEGDQTIEDSPGQSLEEMSVGAGAIPPVREKGPYFV